jgi:hypothetical protein
VQAGVGGELLEFFGVNQCVATAAYQGARCQSGGAAGALLVQGRRD